MTTPAIPAAAPREQLFNAGWRFLPGDPANAETPDFSDAAWHRLDLPHDWSIEREFQPEGNASGTGYLPGGTGWYRKNFTLPAGTKGKRVFLRFEGVYRNSDVWLNGQHLGNRPYGYIDFEYDLTPHLRPPGEQNVVAVRVARENVADSRWYPGTGIYRDTWLTVLEPIHVVRHGSYATTPMVDDGRAEVNSFCEVRNDADAAAAITVTATILDADGQTVGQGTSTRELPAGQEWTFPLYHPVASPRRWDVKDPYLYQLVHTVSVDGRTTDETRTPLGIRVARFDANLGFFLNDRHVLLKGVCNHHDAGNLGAAVPRAVLERRLRILKDIGCNAVRCSHNPMADDFYSLCDQLGLLVMDEAFDEWEGGKRKWVEGRNVGTAQRFGYSVDFPAWAERDAEDMARRSRRHACVVFYSIGNEIDYPTDPYVHPKSDQVEMFKDDPAQPSMNRLAAVAPLLIAAVKRADPTRPVTMALSNVSAANAIGLASMLDVAGYNYHESHYDADHARFPERVLCGSENGHDTKHWTDVINRPFVSGQFLWTGFDFLGEANRWPVHGSAAGLFDTAGFAKSSALLREALWSEKPVLHLRVSRGGNLLSGHPGPSHWNAVPGELAPARVAALTNLPTVTLTLNGRSLGEVAVKRGMAEWDVPWEAGRLEVTGAPDDGGKLTASLESTGAPASIRLTLIADSQDILHITVDLLDAGGRLVTDADKVVAIRPEGPLSLLALETGNLYDNTRPKSDVRSTHHGQALAILRSGSQAGTATIRATVPGLPEAVLSVKIGG